jgi:hypothetical protein
MHNIKILKRNSPSFWLKFLKGLVKKAKPHGGVFHISKITGIIVKEPRGKLWRRINKSTRNSKWQLRSQPLTVDIWNINPRRE